MKIRLRRRPSTVTIRLKRSSIDRRLARVFRLYRASLREPSMAHLKRTIDIVALVTYLTGEEPETRGTNNLWHCPFAHHADLHPSFYARNDYQGTGVGRWGCICGAGSGDCFDLVMVRYDYTLKEARQFLRHHAEDFRL